MPRKRSKLRKPQRSGPRTLRSVRSPTSEVARLRGAFLAWLLDHRLPVHLDPADIWDDVVATVDLAAARAGLTDLGSWTAEQVDVLAAQVPDDDADVLTALPLFLAFLGDTGRWSGTADQLDAALAAAENATSATAEVLEELAGVHVDPATEDAALRALPVVTRAEALLRYVLPRRKVTATGALRRADIAPAAERLGVELGPRKAQSMWDVPGLADTWTTLQDVGLLVVTASEATLSPLAHAWLTGDADQAHQTRLRVAAGHLAALLAQEPDAPWLPHPLDSVLPALAAAALDRPLPIAQVLGLTGSATGAAPPRVGSDAELVRTVAAVPVYGLLTRLTDAGFLRAGETIEAGPGLRAVLARVVIAVLEAQQRFDAMTREDVDLPPPDPALAGQAYRLRIDLAEVDPPVWREVLVDPGTPLDELHQVIQGVFAWDDSHLHEFTAEGAGGRTSRFAPADDEDGWWAAEPTVDESRVRLSQLLGPGPGRLRYRYDFGDSWDHLLTVVDSRPADGPLPRCVAGAGAAPYEDSGGTWGWADKVRAARDPRHPEHADIREWLGLADGGTLDPADFDLTEADESLAHLRSTAVPPG